MQLYIHDIVYRVYSTTNLYGISMGNSQGHPEVLHLLGTTIIILFWSSGLSI